MMQPMAESPLADAADGGGHRTIVRVMTFNVLWGGVRRERLLRDAVAAVQPDIAVFNEVTSEDSLARISEPIGGHLALSQPGLWGERTAIVSRWSLASTRAFGPTGGRRRWVSASVNVGNGREWQIVGVHLLARPFLPIELWRSHEVNAILRHLRRQGQRPTIIAGDFNCLAAGDPPAGGSHWLNGWFKPRWAVTTLSAEGFTDCYRACAPSTNGFTVPSWKPVMRLDYIFVSSEHARTLRSSDVVQPNEPLTTFGLPLRSLAQRLGFAPTPDLGGYASDHLALWADFAC
jgi:endonuclease/exonuclease/phosphatase family metal-dependent hydrolase